VLGLGLGMTVKLKKFQKNREKKVKKVVLKVNK